MQKRFLAAIFVGLMVPAAMAQSVTVGTSGADYTSLNAAIVALGDDVAEPDVITILDEGPFLENRVIVNIGTSDDEDLTIQASPGVRPIIVVKSNADGAFYLRKDGNLTVRDLIIIPTVDFVAGTYEDNVAQAAVVIDDDSGVATSVTLENILISSNDGNNQPIASLDGLTSPTFTENTVSFRDEGINTASAITNATRNVYMYDVIVSGVAGDQGTDGIRGFIDGAPGSEWIIGPGCVVSYNNFNEETITSQTIRAAFQPGGNNGLQVKILGTQDDPVKFINNNSNGIGVTNTTNANEGLTEVQWLIVANNTGAGFVTVDGKDTVNFANVTFANNQDGAFAGPPDADEKTYNLSNIILAGNGDPADKANAIKLIADGVPGIFASFFTANDSAIVLNGPYTLNTVDYGGDGIAHEAPWVVTTSNITNTDPQFISLDPTSGGFAVLGNQSYATAGPGGEPLVGGGKLAPSSVEDWQLF